MFNKQKSKTNCLQVMINVNNVYLIDMNHLFLTLNMDLDTTVNQPIAATYFTAGMSPNIFN